MLVGSENDSGTLSPNPWDFSLGGRSRRRPAWATWLGSPKPAVFESTAALELLPSRALPSEWTATKLTLQDRLPSGVIYNPNSSRAQRGRFPSTPPKQKPTLEKTHLPSTPKS